MKKKLSNSARDFHRDQVGGVKAYLIFAVLFVTVAVHAGWNYLPVLYQCENFRQEMKGTLINTVTMTYGKESLTKKAEKKLRSLANENGLPQDAVIEVTEKNKVLSAYVQFSRTVHILPFGLYDYEYEFEDTATS